MVSLAYSLARALSLSPPLAITPSLRYLWPSQERLKKQQDAARSPSLWAKAAGEVLGNFFLVSGYELREAYGRQMEKLASLAQKQYFERETNDDERRSNPLVLYLADSKKADQSVPQGWHARFEQLQDEGEEIGRAKFI